MPDPSIIEPLRSRLQHPLPGLDAQKSMASISRVDNLKNFKVPDHARQSAVLMLLYPDGEKLFMPLILRQTYAGVHSGQVGLPGGRLEPEDDGWLGAALRETEEEIGVAPHEIDVLGELSPLYIPPSNFLVKPFVGTIGARPEFIPDPVEVAKVIEAPLYEFLDPRNIGEGTVTVRNNLKMQVPRYLIQGHTVWGATAMMMAEFSHLLREITE